LRRPRCGIGRDPVEVRAVLGEFEHGIQAESDTLTAQLNKLVATPVAAPPRILTARGGGPPANYGPGSNRRRQAETLWGNTDYTPLRAEGD
jgi:hypothetical protein